MIYHIVIIIDKTQFLQNSHPQKNTITVVVQHTLQSGVKAGHLHFSAIGTIHLTGWAFGGAGFV